MSSDWPSALEPKQNYSLERSPVGIQSPSDVVSTDEQNSDFVRNATSDLASRVKSLQKSYEDYLEEVVGSLQKQYDVVNDNEGFERVTQVLNQLGEYSDKMDRALKRMEAIYDRVDRLQVESEEMLNVVKTVPPGKPIPPASKQIHDSVNSYVNRAKSSIENTVNSAKSGDMKDKLADSMSSFGEKVSSMMDKAKSSVQNLRNSNVCIKQDSRSKRGNTPWGESTSTLISLLQS